MVRRIGEHYVKLEDGTCWAFDRLDEDGAGLGWVQRYGTESEVLKARLTVAEIMSSYRALIWKPQKRRNEVVAAIRVALNESGAEDVKR